MTENSEELSNRLKRLTSPGIRSKLSAKGLARGIIWRNGELPAGAPAFGPELTSNLLDQGYNLLASALRARDLKIELQDTTRAFVIAAESIESAVRKGPDEIDRGFHLVIAAASFHLAQYAARAFCLLPSNVEALNLSTVERAMSALVKGLLIDLRKLCIEWLENNQHTDESIAGKIEDSSIEFDISDAEVIAILSTMLRGFGLFDSALLRGDKKLYELARKKFAVASEVSGERRYVSLWWGAEISKHLCDTIWERSLHEVLPTNIDAEKEYRTKWKDLRHRYIRLLTTRSTCEIQLWPSQLSAAQRSINPKDDLVVALPTSAGKTRIAELCILRCLAEKKRIIYVTPLRALSAQVEKGLAATFSQLGYSVTSLYGASGVAVSDIGTLKSAEIVVATPEKLDFAVRQEPAVLDDVGLIVLDEGHMIGLGSRELRYEVLVQRLLRRSDAETRRLVCLSAIFSQNDSFADFTNWLRSDDPGEAVASEWRPTRQRSATISWHNPSARLSLTVDDETPFVPKFFTAEAPKGRRRNPFPKDDEEFILASAKGFLGDGHRVLVYCPLRSSVEKLGKSFITLYKQGYLESYLPETVDIKRALAVGKEWLGEDHVAVHCLRLGVAIHHGALPRAFLAEVEELLSKRLLRFTIASPTLAQGIDLSCSVLIFRSIYRNGSVIRPEEYANVIGRAGRAFVDLDGIIVFPVFDDGLEGRKKLRVYRKLQQSALTRNLESGILLLIQELISILTRYTGSTTEEIAEYVLNTTGPWSITSLLGKREAPATSDDDGIDPPTYLLKTLAELDTAVLSTIEDPMIDISRIAEALDSTLQSSLWNRRLQRQTAEDFALQRNIILGRATWIWNNTSAVQRKGFYAAGVSYETGMLIDSQLPKLVGLLREIEHTLSNNDIEKASLKFIELATILFEIPPFTPKELPKSWKILVRRWVSGSELPPILTDSSTEIEFIQTALVYQLVWAVEAIRVLALAKGEILDDEITGMAALSLTYGVASWQATLLMQAGLTSRSVAMYMLSQYPGTFTDSDGLRQWIAKVPDTSGIEEIGLEQDKLLLWKDFARRWAKKAGSNLYDNILTADVHWINTDVDMDTEVRIIYNEKQDNFFVYSADLIKLGHVLTPLPFTETSSMDAKVGPKLSQVVIEKLGPASVNI